MLVRFHNLELEAPPGFEPGIEVLQTSALPLGDGADQECSVRSLAATVPPSLALRATGDNLRLDRGAEVGAGNGIRTRDFDLGKVALYH